MLISVRYDFKYKYKGTHSGGSLNRTKYDSADYCTFPIVWIWFHILKAYCSASPPLMAILSVGSFLYQC